MKFKININNKPKSKPKFKINIKINKPVPKNRTDYIPSKCLEFLRLLSKHINKPEEYRKILRYKFSDLFPSEKTPFDPKLQFLRIGYHLIIEDCKNKGKTPSKKVLDRYEASKTYNIENFDDDIKEIMKIW